MAFRGMMAAREVSNPNPADQLDPKRLCLVLVSPKGAPEQPATKDVNSYK